LSFRLFGCR